MQLCARFAREVVPLERSTTPPANIFQFKAGALTPQQRRSLWRVLPQM
jgi:hypothetical protein